MDLSIDDSSGHFDPTELYRAIARTPPSNVAGGSNSMRNMTSTLRTYQQRAVTWMIHREKKIKQVEQEHVSSLSGNESFVEGDEKDEESDDSGALIEQQLSVKGKEKEPDELSLHPLWQECFGLNEQGERIPFYFNEFTAKFSLNKYEPPPDISGGILADEMGIKSFHVLCWWHLGKC